jgi:hypothetical protein
MQPSALLLGLIAVISMAACAVAVYLPLPILLKIALIIMVLVSSAYFCWRDIALNLPQSWQNLAVDNKGILRVNNRRGQQYQPILAANSFIHPSIIILNFKKSAEKISLPPLILLKTTQNAEEFRKLSVWLRWFKHDKTTQDDAQEDLSAAAD